MRLLVSAFGHVASQETSPHLPGPSCVNATGVVDLVCPPEWPVLQDLPRLDPCTRPDCAAISRDFNPESDVFFLLYTAVNTNIGQRLRPHASAFQNSHFSAQRPTKILVHGWITSVQSPNYLLMSVARQTYLAMGNYNVIFMDWSRRAIGTYLRAAGDTVGVALALARFLETLVQVGAQPATIHIVGHSLGAHVAGIAGFNVSSSMTIGRVTGLDPAGWLFDVPMLQPAHLRLSDASAEFVDVIHSTGGLTGLGVGTTKPLGHADFFPNRGEAPQPGCRGMKRLSCSHTRALLLFIESIKRPDAFVATSCSGWPTFERGTCDSNQRSPMGEPAQRGLRGQYFLRTNSDHPFGLGNSGSGSSNGQRINDLPTQTLHDFSGLSTGDYFDNALTMTADENNVEKQT